MLRQRTSENNVVHSFIPITYMIKLFVYRLFLAFPFKLSCVLQCVIVQISIIILFNIIYSRGHTQGGGGELDWSTSTLIF